MIRAHVVLVALCGLAIASAAWGQPTATHLFKEEVDDSAGLAAVLTDETGSGLACFATSPTLTTPLFSGKIDADAGAVNDDDCTGEQGLWWYDDTDAAFEFCNANSGVPAQVLSDRKLLQVVIADPDPTAVNYVFRLPPYAGTMTRIDCECYNGTNVVINICDGEDYADDTCTTSIPGATMTCTTTGANDTTLSAAGFAARDKVSLVLVSESGTCDRLEVYITGRAG